MTGNSNARRIVDTPTSWPAQTPGPLVLGFGNVLLSDDGAGVRLMERLRDELGPSAAEFVDGGTMSFSLLSHVEAATSILVIDAANIHEPPATIGVFEGMAMDLLDCARLLGCLPSRRALICIQPQSIDWSTSLSGTVERALSEAAQQAKAIMQAWRDV
jgi:hydrogenase maturation protease